MHLKEIFQNLNEMARASTPFTTLLRQLLTDEPGITNKEIAQRLKDQAIEVPLNLNTRIFRMKEEMGKKAPGYVPKTPKAQRDPADTFQHPGDVPSAPKDTKTFINSWKPFSTDNFQKGMTAHSDMLPTSMELKGDSEDPYVVFTFHGSSEESAHEFAIHYKETNALPGNVSKAWRVGEGIHSWLEVHVDP